MIRISVIGIIEVNDLCSLMIQDFGQGLGITAIPLGDGDDGFDLRSRLKGGINALDPTAQGPGETFFLGFFHPGGGLGEVIKILFKSTGTQPAAKRISTGIVEVIPMGLEVMGTLLVLTIGLFRF